MKNAVYCLAENQTQVEFIVNALKSSGFPNTQISVLFPDKSGTHDFAHEKNTKLPEGAAAGGAAGMGAGAILGWLAGMGSLAIPGIGPFIAAGPIMATLGGAALGGATGGLVGGLVGMGIPEYEAKLFDGKIRSGNILISAHTEKGDQEKKIREIYARAGATDIKSSFEANIASY
jgi:hypothetical protein